MKILLVNSNPVVSRLTALSARKESVKLDEIKSISELKKNDYDVVFVDFEAYSDELAKVLENSNIPRKVLFYTQDDKDKPEVFNLSILKPFLPSEVSAILRESKIELEERAEEAKEEHLDLDELIADKKDDLEPISLVKEELVATKIDEKIEEKKEDIELEPINLFDNVTVEPKVEEKLKKKEEIELEPLNLIDDKSQEEELLSELDKSKEKIKNIEKSPDLRIEVQPLDVPKEESKLFELDIKDDKKESDDNSGLFESDEKSDEFKDELLDFDMSSKDEVDFDAITKVTASKKDETPKKDKTLKEEESTKILDKDEISNIQSLLSDDKATDEDITLEDIMTTTTSPTSKTKKKFKKKKKNKKPKELVKKAGSKVIIDSLGSLPVDDLRRLLLGSEVHITIKFPKE